jgi:predicted small metal-binding protein
LKIEINSLNKRKELTKYKYACRDLGVDCDFSTAAESPEEVKKAIFAHADVVHKEMLQSMNPEQLADLDKSVEGAIKPA